MNRRHCYRTFAVKVDVKYKSWHVSKLINCIMRYGEKLKAIKIVYAVFSKLEEDYQDKSAHDVFMDVIGRLKPSVYLRSRRIASRVYRVPVVISDLRATKKAIGWLIKGANIRKERTMVERLLSEMKAVIDNSKSEAVKIKDHYHKVAKDNEAFVHYV